MIDLLHYTAYRTSAGHVLTTGRAVSAMGSKPKPEALETEDVYEIEVEGQRIVMTQSDWKLLKILMIPLEQM